MPQRDTYEKINDSEILSLDLILDSGDPISLLDMYVEFSVFQDLFGTPMTCEMIVADANDVLQSLPIKNNEMLNIGFYSPGNNPVNMTMFLYSRENVVLNKSGSTTYYKLKFISPEVIQNSKIKTSRSYTGTISDIAGAIWSDNFPDSVPLNTAASEGEHTLVLPFDSPFSHIKHLSQKAMKSEHECGFFFFEDFSGWNFASLSDMFTQEIRPDSYFTHRLKSTGQELGKDLFSSRFIFKDVEFLGKENHLDELTSGVYSGFVTKYDVRNKSVNHYSYSYEDGFATTTHLNEHQIAPSTVLEDACSSTLANYHLYNGVFSPDSLIKRKSQINSFIGRRFRFSVAGNSSLNVGDKVTIDFSKQKFSEKVGEDLKDKYRSGVFLVTSVRHKLSKINGYTMSVEVCSDSYASPIPDESRFESNQTGTEGEQR